MYVKTLTLENFKSYRGKHEFTFVPGLNCIVGDNNCGKSSLFEAITYLMGIGRMDETQKCKVADGPMRVQMDIAGLDLPEVLGADKYRQIRNFLISIDGIPTLRIERSPKQRTATQSGKEKSLDNKMICVWNAQNDPPQFENRTGIDAAFKGLIDFQAVWADTIPGDVTDFGATKILGKIIDTQIKKFSDTPTWKDFLNAYRCAFSEDAGSLSKLMDDLASNIAEIVQEQYGQAGVRFDFAEPDAAALAKGGSIYVDDGAGETDLNIKGTGMQRAFALALIQILAKVSDAQSDTEAPLILLVDEPETWLHPQAQLKLGKALHLLAQSQQIFLITHSPYLLREFNPDTDQLMVFNGKGIESKVTPQNVLGITTPGQPSWGEINYTAFGIVSQEYLDELYACIIDRIWADGQRSDSGDPKESEIDTWLVSHGLKQSRIWIRTNGKKYDVTLPIFARNSIHHRENRSNPDLSASDLDGAIKELIEVCLKFPLAAMAAPTPVVP